MFKLLSLLVLAAPALSAPLGGLKHIRANDVPSDLVAKRGLLGNLLAPVDNLLTVGNVVQGATDMVDNVLNVALGINLNLDVDTFLTCNHVNGSYAGQDYDLGCTCSGDGLGLLLNVDVDVAALTNVVGLDAFVKAQVDLGLGFDYPAHSQPTCDGKGGFTCPGGNCNVVTPSASPSPSPCPEETITPFASVSPSPSPVPSSTWSEEPAPPPSSWSQPEPTFVAAASTPASSWTPSWTPTSAPATTWADAQPTTSNVAVQETPVSDDDDDDLEDCEEDEEEDPTLTAYAAATTVTLDTIYVLEATTTAPAETITNTVTITNIVTVTDTVTADCAPAASTNNAVVWSASPSPTPAPSSVNVAAVSPSPTPSPVPSPSVSAVVVDDGHDCPDGKHYDIELKVCVDVCLGVQDLLGVCISADADVELDL